MSLVKNAIIYCRVSSKGQLEGGGLNSQEVSCRRYCQENGYNVINVFQDAFSGGDLDRPGMNNLLKFIDKCEKETSQKISLFVVDDIDRIARDYSVHLTITKELRKRQIEYQTVKMKFESTPVGTFIEGTMALQAEFFRLQNKERVISRQEARLLDGYRPRDYPLGYKTEKALAGGKLLIPDYPNAEYIREALEGYANGLLGSISEVASFLDKKGLDLSRYKKKKKNTNTISKSSVGRMLNNILYAGIIEYKETSRYKDGIIKKKRDIPARPGKHQGLISLETFYKIQAKLTDKRPYTHEVKVINDDYPLRGYIVCSCCGLSFTSGKSKGKAKRYGYYQFNKKCIYKGKSIQSDKLHITINDKISNLSIDKRFLSLMKILITKEFDDRKKGKTLNEVSIKKEISRLEQEMDNLLNTIASTTSELVRRKLEQKIEEVELNKIKLQGQLHGFNKDINILKTIDLAFEILNNPSYIREKGTIDQKQMLLNLIFSKKIPIDFSTGTYGTLPFNSLFLLSESILDTHSQHLEMTGVEPVSERYPKRSYLLP